MNTKISIAGICIVALFAAQSCDKINTKDQPNKIQLTLKSAEIIESDQQFAFELFSELCALSDEENIMISPLSVSYALGMTYNGASSTTLDAFIDVLHFDKLTNQEVNESYKDLMGQLIKLNDDIEFSIANSIWYKEGANVLNDFITTNQNYFDAAVEELDFSDPGSVDVINNWIENKTNDKIQDMLDYIPEDTYMYLVNAIYFNASWKYEFDPNDTYSDNFTLETGETKLVDYMKIKSDFYYTYTEDYAAVELPYGKGEFSMVAILPSEENSISDVLDSLNPETWNSRDQYSSSHEILVEIPKFTYEFKGLLNDALSNLGLGLAFGGNADFSRITAEANLFISRVIHQTFIDVNEEGTEAAAATIVEMNDLASAGPTSIKFDKPFLYIIKENSTGAILFMGKVGNP